MPSSPTDPRTGRFASLQVRNYRLYFVGQLLSQPGTYIQTVGQAWLVLDLTHSGADLGLVLAAQYLPVLFFGPWGGVIADRFDNRRIMLMTQSSAGILATALGVLVLTGTVQLWMVMLLAGGFGAVMVADSPARQSFASEMVGVEQVANAIALSMILNNLARVIGPAIGAGLIAVAGIGYCFVVNGISYFAVVLALLAMDRSKIFPRPRSDRTKGELRAGFAHVASRPVLRDTLIMLAMTGVVSAGLNILMPLLAKRTFHGNATTYALLTTFTGVGAVVGAISMARAIKPSMRTMAALAGSWTVCIALSAALPTLVTEDIDAIGVGLFATMFTINANITLQQRSAPEMRGRVMALWAVALLGTSPIAGPIFGYVADRLGPRPTLGLAAIAASTVATVAFLSSARERREARLLLAGTPDFPLIARHTELGNARVNGRFEDELEAKEA